MDKFDDLQAFVAVVDAGSFTAAADLLDADKSAVSRRVSSLEDRLGVQLLRRTTRTISVTDTGRSFYDRSVQILSDLEEAESAAAQEHGELKGRLRVALPHSFGIRHMGDPIAEFSQLHPGVEFDLDLSDRFVDLLQEGVDLAVRIGRLSDSSLIARRLFESQAVVCASKAYLDRHGMPAKTTDLADHDCLLYSGTADPERWAWIDASGEQQSVVVRRAMAANSGDLLLDAAAAGLGITRHPTFLAHEYLRDGRLVPILDDVNWTTATGYAVYPPTRHLSYRVRAFIDFLAVYFEGVPYWDEDCARAAKV